MNHELKTNGLSSREANGPGGGGSAGESSPRLSRWEAGRLGTNSFRGSLESLASRDWDAGSDRVSEEDHCPRVLAELRLIKDQQMLGGHCSGW